MNVREIMTINPVCATQDTSLEEVARMMVENDCGQIPVVEDTRSRRTIGVVTDRDIVCRVVARGENPARVAVREAMSVPAITVRPDMSVEDCCTILEEKQLRRAPVEDEHGRCCGIVSIADIAQTSPEKLTGEVVRSLSQRTAWASGKEPRGAL